MITLDIANRTNYWIDIDITFKLPEFKLKQRIILDKESKCICINYKYIHSLNDVYTYNRLSLGDLYVCPEYIELTKQQSYIIQVLITDGQKLIDNLCNTIDKLIELSRNSTTYEFDSDIIQKIKL
jgi:hypothetical protein